MSNNNVHTVPESPFPKQQAFQIGHINLKGQKVPVKIHWLLPIFWVLSLLSGLRYGGTYIGFRFVIDVIILFFTVFIHEIGHSIAAINYSGTCHSITLWPLGGFAEVTHGKGPKEDLWVSFAGPLTHIPMCAIWYGIVAGVVRHPFNIMNGVACDLIGSQKCFWTNVAASAGFLNLCLFLFNLFIPAYPLDASRILVDFFALCKVEVNRAALITACISLPIGLALLGYGFWAFAKGAANYSMTIFLAIFILYSTWGVFKAARDGMAARHPMFIHYYRQSDGSSSSSSSSSNSSFPSLAPSRITTFSSMEQGKGGHKLGGGGAPPPAGSAPGTGAGGSRLLGGSSSSSSASSGGGMAGKGYRLGSK